MYNITAHVNGQVLTLTMKVTAGSDWLQPTLSSPTTPAILSVNVFPAGLAPGFHYGEFTVTGGGNDLIFLVSLNVIDQPKVGALVVSPSRLDFKIDPNWMPTGIGSLNVTSTGGQIAYKVSSPDKWITVIGTSPDMSGSGAWTGTTPGSVSVFADPGTMPPGTYNGSVIFTSGQATNGSLVVPVSMVVPGAPSPVVPVASASPDQLIFNCDTSATKCEQVLHVRTDHPEKKVCITAYRGGGVKISTALPVCTPTDLQVSVDMTNPNMGRPGTSWGTLSLFFDADRMPSLDVSVTINITDDKRPKITQISNAASWKPVVSPGSWMSILGTNLAFSTQQAQFLPQPTTFNGVTVYIDGLLCRVNYTSPTQINVVVPFGVKPGDSTITVQTPNGSASGKIKVEAVAPALFIRDQFVAAVNLDGTIIGNTPGFSPTRPGKVIALYGTGFGQTDPPSKDDATFTDFPAPIVEPVRVWVGDNEAKVIYAGIVGVGLYQINIEVPAATIEGTNPAIMVQMASGAVSKQAEAKIAVE
jgi:uncharacterized protein (TIGR03437 family)